MRARESYILNLRKLFYNLFTIIKDQLASLCHDENDIITLACFLSIAYFGQSFVSSKYAKYYFDTFAVTIKGLVAPDVEWFVCSVTVREFDGSTPSGTKVVIPVYTLLSPSVAAKQGFVRNHWYLTSDDRYMRINAE